MIALCDISYFGDSSPSPAEHKAKERFEFDRKWEEMRSYLDNVDKVKERYPDKSSPKIGGKKLLFALGVAAALLVFLGGPIAGFSMAGAGAESLPWTLAIAVLGTGVCTSVLYDLTWHSIKKETDDAKYRAEEKASWIRYNKLDHDDGDNDLDEVRLIVKSLDNIENNFAYAARIADRKAVVRSHIDQGKKDMLREGKAKQFLDTSRKYVVLSYWDGYEKKLVDGFDRIVMRTSAAWKAYLEVFDEGIENEYVPTAEANIDKVFDNANKLAYRNFSKVDAKIHGEEHIFDLPDAPDALTNMAKLSIAASMFDDEE